MLFSNIPNIPVFHVSFQLLFCFLAAICIIFDVILFLAAVHFRKDTTVPFAYLTVMTVCGIFCKIAFITDFMTYLVLSYSDYLAYRQLLGKEFTLMGTLTYFIPMCVSVLMTLNRLFIVVKPTNQQVFGQRRIFIYSFGILILCLTLLLIPYFSTCPVNFLASTLVFVTACAPERHPVTRFTNYNAIWVPIMLLLVNCLLVIYLKAARYDIYTRMVKKSSVVSLTSSSSLANFQKRREHMLMRQTVALAIYLSFYEVGSFLMRTFPEPYAKLPVWLRDAYFYFRLETICYINFFVYFMEGPSTRKMLRKFLGWEEERMKRIGGLTTGTHKISSVIAQSKAEI